MLRVQKVVITIKNVTVEMVTSESIVKTVISFDLATLILSTGCETFIISLFVSL